MCRTLLYCLIRRIDKDIKLNVARYILLVLNPPLAIGGLAAAVLGAYGINHNSQIVNYTHCSLVGFPLGLMAAGIILFSLYLGGMFAAWSRKLCALGLYGITVFALGILSIFVIDIVSNILHDFLLVLETTPELTSSYERNVTAFIEFYAQCCGVTGKEYYSLSFLPMTCCPSSEWEQLRSYGYVYCPYSFGFDYACKDRVIDLMEEMKWNYKPLINTISILQIWLGVSGIYVALN